MKVKNLTSEITASKLLLNAKMSTKFAVFPFLFGVKHNLVSYAAFTLTFEVYDEVLT